MEKKITLLLILAFLSIDTVISQTVLRRRAIAEKLETIDFEIKQGNFERAIDIFFCEEEIIIEENVGRGQLEDYNSIRQLLNEKLDLFDENEKKLQSISININQNDFEEAINIFFSKEAILEEYVRKVQLEEYNSIKKILYEKRDVFNKTKKKIEELFDEFNNSNRCIAEDLLALELSNLDSYKKTRELIANNQNALNEAQKMCKHYNAKLSEWKQMFNNRDFNNVFIEIYQFEFSELKNKNSNKQERLNYILSHIYPKNRNSFESLALFSKEIMSIKYDYSKLFFPNTSRRNFEIFLEKYRQGNSKEKNVLSSAGNVYLNSNNFANDTMISKDYEIELYESIYNLEIIEMLNNVSAILELRPGNPHWHGFQIFFGLAVNSQMPIPINLIRIANANKEIKESFDKAIESESTEDLFAFRDIFYYYYNELINERDSLLKKDLIHFRSQRIEKDNYLNDIGFRQSIDLLQKMKPSLSTQARHIIIEEFKSDKTKLSIFDIIDYSVPFMQFNPFSTQNYDKYFQLAITVIEETEPETLIYLFNLSDKYTTDLQIYNFKNSSEYKELSLKKDSLRKETLANIYSINLRPTRREGELIAGDLFTISNYDLSRKGFNLQFEPFDTPRSSFVNNFSKIVPGLINRVFFEKIPFEKTNADVSSIGGLTSGSGKNILFLACEPEIGLKIEETGRNLGLKLLFALDGDILMAPNDDVFPYLKSSKSKLILFDKRTNEVLLSKLYN